MDTNIKFCNTVGVGRRSESYNVGVPKRVLFTSTLTTKKCLSCFAILRVALGRIP